MLVVAGREPLPVAQARTGDPDAWDALFRRYQLPLYAYVIELVRDEQMGLDIVQETFIAATRHLGSLREDARFGSWLFSIAHQKVVQRWRKPLFTEPLDEAQFNEQPADDARPDDWLIRKEQQEEFMKLLHDLPLPQREVLLLHFIEDFSLDEIATITGAALGTVKSRLHYAKRALRALLEERTP
jgi:RNA polymerase sigma-70 factor, ECF subfamily